MPSLPSLAARRTKAERALKMAAVQAVKDGRPVTLVAREAGVTRATIYAWIQQA